VDADPSKHVSRRARAERSQALLCRCWRDAYVRQRSQAIPQFRSGKPSFAPSNQYRPLDMPFQGSRFDCVVAAGSERRSFVWRSKAEVRLPQR
jgi:hypothetical protein